MQRPSKCFDTGLRLENTLETAAESLVKASRVWEGCEHVGAMPQEGLARACQGGARSGSIAPAAGTLGIQTFPWNRPSHHCDLDIGRFPSFSSTRPAITRSGDRAVRAAEKHGLRDQP